MSEHTKGPWTVRTTGQHWNNPDLLNIEINYGEDQECVCDTVYEMADARLIAAAPDMRDALKLCVELLEQIALEGDALEAAKAALKQVEG